MKKQEVSQTLKSDQLSIFLLSFSLFVTLASFAYLLYNFQEIPPVIPLFFSLIRNETQLANKLALFVLPTASVAFLLTHFIIVKAIYDTDKMFTRLVSASTALVCLLLATSVFQIVRMVV